MKDPSSRPAFAQRTSDSQCARNGQESTSLANVWEKFYVIIALVYLASPFIGLFASPGQALPDSSGTVGELALQTFVYLTAGVFILRHWRSFVRGLSDCRWAIALIGLAVLSALWVADPLRESRKSLVMAATTIFGIYFGTRYRRDEQVALLCCAVGTIAIMSIVMIVLFPEYGIDHSFCTGCWRGVFATKNAFARVMVLGAVALSCAPQKWLGTGVLRLACLAACAVLTILSGSQTAVVTGVLLLAVTRMYMLMRFRVTVVIPLLMISLLLFAFLVNVLVDQQDTLLGLLGRDSTFTGRLPLWNSVLVEIGRRPLLGYGFASFWNGMAGPSATVVIAVGWYTPHAHNGFLDLCLDLGIVGLLTFGIGFVLRFRTAILEYRAVRSRAAIWPLAFLTFMVLYNLTESSLLRTNNIYWALYTAALVHEVPGVVRWENRSAREHHGESEVDGCPA